MRRLSIVAAVAISYVSAGGAETPVESIQFDAKRLDFSVADAKGFIILPTQAAADGSHPWVWYAPTFIGHHPDDSHTWMAAQLLDAGFAICGIDVGESYGSPDGTAKYAAFYSHVVETYGLDAKPCLLPQSRGGLMLLNWAIENPEKVQCIAGIYTVCNIESYPGVEKACGAYGMTAEELAAQLARYNPIRRANVLAEAKVPLLFIHGDSDKAVPVEKNAGEFVEQYRAFGGNAELIVIPGKGHEVCPEFFQSAEFIAFLLAQGRTAPEE
jgi:dipeptidyl aminopeptidase/acylaminoacyl peptidase